MGETQWEEREIEQAAAATARGIQVKKKEGEDAGEQEALATASAQHRHRPTAGTATLSSPGARKPSALTRGAGCGAGGGGGERGRGGGEQEALPVASRTMTIDGAPMTKGKHRMRFTVKQHSGRARIGVATAKYYTAQSGFASDTSSAWAWQAKGILSHGGPDKNCSPRYTREWKQADILELLLDCDAGTLMAFKNNSPCKEPVATGLPRGLRWLRELYYDGDEIQLQSVAPKEVSLPLGIEGLGTEGEASSTRPNLAGEATVAPSGKKANVNAGSATSGAVAARGVKAGATVAAPRPCKMIKLINNQSSNENVESVQKQQLLPCATTELDQAPAPAPAAKRNRLQQDSTQSQQQPPQQQPQLDTKEAQKRKREHDEYPCSPGHTYMRLALATVREQLVPAVAQMESERATAATAASRFPNSVPNASPHCHGPARLPSPPSGLSFSISQAEEAARGRSGEKYKAIIDRQARAVTGTKSKTKERIAAFKRPKCVEIQITAIMKDDLGALEKLLEADEIVAVLGDGSQQCEQQIKAILESAKNCILADQGGAKRTGSLQNALSVFNMLLKSEEYNTPGAPNVEAMQVEHLQQQSLHSPGAPSGGKVLGPPSAEEEEAAQVEHLDQNGAPTGQNVSTVQSKRRRVYNRWTEEETQHLRRGEYVTSRLPHLPGRF
jgi:hypothetical protein